MADPLGAETPHSGPPGRRLSEIAAKAAARTADCCGAGPTGSGLSPERPGAVPHPDLSALGGVQLRSGQGPIPGAAEEGKPVDAVDLLSEERWPLYRAVALDSGVRSS